MLKSLQEVREAANATLGTLGGTLLLLQEAEAASASGEVGLIFQDKNLRVPAQLCCVASARSGAAGKRACLDCASPGTGAHALEQPDPSVAQGEQRAAALQHAVDAARQASEEVERTIAALQHLQVPRMSAAWLASASTVPCLAFEGSIRLLVRVRLQHAGSSCSLLVD